MSETKKKRCDNHYWFIEHAVYEGQKGRPDEAGIYRQCANCGKKQMAFTMRWKNPPKRYQLKDLRT